MSGIDHGLVVATALREVAELQRELLDEVRGMRLELRTRRAAALREMLSQEERELLAQLEAEVPTGWLFSAAELAEALGVEDVNALGRALSRLEGVWLERCGKNSEGVVWARRCDVQ